MKAALEDIADIMVNIWEGADKMTTLKAASRVPVTSYLLDLHEKLPWREGIHSNKRRADTKMIPHLLQLNEILNSIEVVEQLDR